LSFLYSIYLNTRQMGRWIKGMHMRNLEKPRRENPLNYPPQNELFLDMLKDNVYSKTYFPITSVGRYRYQSGIEHYRNNIHDYLKDDKHPSYPLLHEPERARKEIVEMSLVYNNIASSFILSRPFLLKLRSMRENKLIRKIQIELNKKYDAISYANHLLVKYLTSFPIINSYKRYSQSMSSRGYINIFSWLKTSDIAKDYFESIV
ncbi:hypothetical protein K8R78_01260, partial [bacterium]|nr:hypothetical protein [bacterium]